MSGLDRLYDLLTSGTGVIRTRNPELEAAAAARALEARHQVGLTVHEDPALNNIIHPSQAQCEARLGPQWSGKGVGELATWNYLYNDPILAAANGLLNSPVHRAVLDNPTYMYWGAGIYTELPPGSSELGRRWYIIVWVSKLIPPTPPAQTFTDVPPSHRFFDDIEWAADLGIALGSQGKFNPDAPATKAQVIAFIRRALE